MEVYRVEDDDLHRIKKQEFAKEQHLEDRLTRPGRVQIGNVDILIIDRQGGFDDTSQDSLDILGIDKNGNTVIVELKQNKGRRKVIAQALDYTSRIRNDNYERLDERYQNFNEGEKGKQQLRDVHAEHFDLGDPLSHSEFNSESRIVLVGTDFDTRLVDTADFLREHDIDVVLVEYETYQDEDRGIELLTTNAIRRPKEEEPSTSSDDSYSPTEQRQKQFWEKFQDLYREEGLSGSSPGYTASHAIYVFTSGNNRKPAYIRPTLNIHKGPYVVIRFYDQTFVGDSENQSAFKEAVTRAISESMIDLSSELPNEFDWDKDDNRNFDKVTIYNTSTAYNNLTDEETLEEVRTWFLDVSKVFKSALEEMAQEDRLNQ